MTAPEPDGHVVVARRTADEDQIGVCGHHIYARDLTGLTADGQVMCENCAEVAAAACPFTFAGWRCAEQAGHDGPHRDAVGPLPMGGPW